MNVLGFIVLIGALIFFHELGHFLAAKLLGVKVLRFSIGFGPRLLGFERRGTEYWLAALPLGGYVKMAGQDPSVEVAPEDRGRGFLDQSPWRRLLISLAGPAFNLLLALIVYLGFAVQLTGTNEIGTVMPRSPAEAAGLRSGDRILSVTVPGEAARPVRYFEELKAVISPHAGEPLVLEVERDGARLAPLTIKPASGPDSDPLGEPVQRGYLGVLGRYPSAAVAPVRPGAAGPLQPFDLVVTAAGKPIRNGAVLARAIAAAACAPIDLEVIRDRPLPMPGVVLAEPERVALAGVPTCAAGAATILLADPALSAVVGTVQPGGPADAAGLRRGDVIEAVDGKEIRSPQDLVTLAGRGEFATGKPVELRLNDGRVLQLVPGAEGQSDRDRARGQKPRPLLGFGFSYGGADLRSLLVPEIPVRLGGAELATVAWRNLTSAVWLVGRAIGKLVTSPSLEGVAGPVGLFQVTSFVIEQSGWGGFLELLATVSVNLALLNLLPIPVLDGGNIGQSLVEMVMRRPLSMRTRLVTNFVGLAVILSLMVVVYGNDILRVIQLHR